MGGVEDKMGGNPSDGAIDVYSVSGVSGEGRMSEEEAGGIGMDRETGVQGVWEETGVQGWRLGGLWENQTGARE